MSKKKIGINGFGRIGRNLLRIIKANYCDEIEVVGINDVADLSTSAHLFKYDSTYGAYKGSVEVDNNSLVIDGHKISVFKERNPADIPWVNLGVEVVIESTGKFVDAIGNPDGGISGANVHINQGGAKKVIISAPAKNEDLTVVLGVNSDQYNPKLHHVISNASCTTNCLALPAKVVNDEFGIVYGAMTTIHSYTNDQNTIDAPHKDLRRARAAAQNIIPTTTGAARAVSLVIPELSGKFDGYALRVPTSTVSIVDFTALVDRNVTVDTLNQKLKEAADDGPMKDYLGYSSEPLVSSDYIGDARSSIIDAKSTIVMGERIVKVVAWYDNEWGYASRTADLTAMVAKSL